jgi:hypothetical protein
VSPSNARKIVDSWFASRKSLVTRFGARLQHDLAAAGDNEEDASQQKNSTVEDVWQQLQQIADNANVDHGEERGKKCMDFEWYLKKASLGSLITPRNDSSIQFGLLQVSSCSSSLEG